MTDSGILRDGLVIGGKVTMARMYLAVILSTIFLLACNSSREDSTSASSMVDADTIVPNEPEHVGQVSDDGRPRNGHTGGRIAAETASTGPADLPVNDPPYRCESNTSLRGLIPHPTDAEFNSELAKKARDFERVYWSVSTQIQGMNADVSLTDEDAKAAVQLFVDQGNSWDLEATTGRNATSVIARSGKGAGLYAGMGIAADAYRSAQLRSGHGQCDDVEHARLAVKRGLEVLHMATAITGEKGVMVRALARAGTPGDGMNTLTPLFDDAGEPLPAEKNNGTWRADNSGRYEGYIWEDSCSRDMLIGWVVAYAAVWEVIARDPAFDNSEKMRLRQDAWEVLESLMVVREDGYDLEIRDADGRRTFHGILNENSIDRVYFDEAPNGFNAVMAVGIVAALAYVSGDAAHVRYLQDTLVVERDLLGLADRWLSLLHAGTATNFSGYNMIFTAAWLALRYVEDESTQNRVRTLVTDVLYPAGGALHPPIEQGQALYDLVAAVAYARASVGQPGYSGQTVEMTMDKVVKVLEDFPGPPLFGAFIENCDPDEVERNDCVGLDGTPLPLADTLGWNDVLSADVPVPMSIRPRSNYYWRSSPYQVNGNANPLDLMPASDFRFVYWAARHVQVGQPSTSASQ